MNKVRSEDTPVYSSVDTGEDRRQQEIIDEALAILMLRLREPGTAIESPDQTRDYLTLKLAEKEREHFCVLFLDNRHRVIEFESLFEGTVDGCSVHPREVVKRALQLNCAAVILAHNHPSGIAEPSRADTTITKHLVDALALVDVQVLDHVVIGHGQSVSFAERGLI